MKAILRRWLLGDLEQRMTEIEFSSGIERQRAKANPPPWLRRGGRYYLQKDWQEAMKRDREDAAFYRQLASNDPNQPVAS
jgi:hypothetical protein